MDQASPTVKNSSAIPAHLLIGSSDAALKKSIALLQHALCPHHFCGTCATCRKIKERRHHSVMWIAPEKNYTRDQFAPLFAQLAFELDTNEQFFFVIEKADFLTLSCANSLLKSLEEPPHGYQFFLLAQRLNAIVPTIRSRCAIHQLASTSTPYANHSLFDFFTSSTFHDPTLFLKAVDQSGITERESVELLDALLSHWISIYRTATIKNDVTKIIESSRAIKVFSAAHEKPPMPGSSKLFWKDLFLSIKGTRPGIETEEGI